MDSYTQTGGVFFSSIYLFIFILFSCHGKCETYRCAHLLIIFTVTIFSTFTVAYLPVTKNIHKETEAKERKNLNESINFKPHYYKALKQKSKQKQN